MSSLFLDCGTGLGNSFEHFRKIYSIQNYDYVLFEPNPYCYDKLLELYSIEPIVIQNKAIHTKNCKHKFYLYNKYDVGGSLVKEHNSNFSQSSKLKNFNVEMFNKLNITDYKIDTFEIDVDCIDINEYIIDNRVKYKNIIMLLDIESNEYNVLESLIQTKNIYLIDKLYCQFHSNFMSFDYNSLYKEREIKIKTFLNENNILVEII